MQSRKLLFGILSKKMEAFARDLEGLIKLFAKLVSI